MRYGRHGCTSPRLPADDLDNAVLTALIDLYANSVLLDRAIAAERLLRSHRYKATVDELAGLNVQRKNTEEALDRYLTAFEQRKLTADECAERIRAHRARLDQVTWRHNDLQHELMTEPVGPTEAAMNLLRQQLTDVYRHGTPGQRKAIIETHIAEITLSQDKIVPVFRVPQETQMPVEHSTGIPDTVRSPLTVAPPARQNANRVPVIEGPTITLSPSGTRRRRKP